MSQEAQVQGVLDHLWRRFRGFAAEGRQIDMQVWTNYLAFDVVSQLGMGGPIGFIGDGADRQGIMAAVHQIFYVAASGGYLPGQMMFLQWPRVQAAADLLGAGQGFKRFREWSEAQVKARMAGGPGDSKRGGDLLDHFISMREPDGRRATEASVMAEVGNLIGAGADTAAVGIAVVLGQLAEHPGDLARLRREVDEAYESLAASGRGGDAELGLRELEALPFLGGCVHEGTRLCPSIVWQLPREAPEGGITVAGYYIPPGATLGMSPMAHNRSREIFGDDADEWRPQRWLPTGEMVDGKAVKSERQRRMEKYNVTVSLLSSSIQPSP